MPIDSKNARTYSKVCGFLQCLGKVNRFLKKMKILKQERTFIWI